ncbi:MAG TPA: CGNR zinc finger domain-containing protein [Mycobacteriales bacterium]|nr:CGNR zinc finger domain-containing protein [Mycobacteriales bacterium]
MHFNPYGGLAAQLAAATVNLGPDASASDLRRLFDAYGYLPGRRPSAAGATELGAWAARLRELFAEPDRDARVELANALLAATAARPFISQHDGRAPHLHFAAADAGLVDRFKAYTAAGLAHAICEDAARISTCGREGCATVFVDTSRNGRRRFCSPRCANRVNVSEYRKRRLNI